MQVAVRCSRHCLVQELNFYIYALIRSRASLGFPLAGLGPRILLRSLYIPAFQTLPAYGLAAHVSTEFALIVYVHGVVNSVNRPRIDWLLLKHNSLPKSCTLLS